MPLLTLSNLLLERAVLEVRYDKAFMLWDRAGAVGVGFRQVWDDIDLTGAEPGKLTFRLRDVELIVELERSRVTAHFPNIDLKDFVAVLKPFIDNIQANLAVHDYSRIGMRLIFAKNFPSLTDATAALMTLKRVALPSEKFFGLEGAPRNVDCAIRWESPKIGATVRLMTHTEMLEVTPSPMASRDVERIKKEKHKFTFDVDYYTVAAVNASQWRVGDWVDSVYHAIKRDSRNFLENL